MIHSSSNLILINHFVVYAELEFSTTFICILAYSRDVLLLDLFKALIRVVLRRVISQARSLNLWSSSVSRFSAIHGFKRVLFRCLSLLLWCRGLGRVGNRILLLHAQRANVGILRSACLRCLRLLLLWRHSKTGKQPQSTLRFGWLRSCCRGYSLGSWWSWIGKSANLDTKCTAHR